MWFICQKHSLFVDFILEETNIDLTLWEWVTYKMIKYLLNVYNKIVSIKESVEEKKY